MREYVKLDRARFWTFIFAILPILVYLAGSGSYGLYEIGNESIVVALSIVPRFDWMYRWYVGNYGIDGAQRFLVLAFYFMLLFLIQIVFIACLAARDLRQSKPIRPFNDLISMAALILMVGVFVLFFFFPSFPKDMNTRMGRLVMFTDVKYFLIAALYWFFVSFVYIVIVTMGQILMPRNSSKSG